jgi:hypothetical protein
VLDAFLPSGQHVGMVRRSFLWCVASLLLTLPAVGFNFCSLQHAGHSRAGLPVGLIIKHAEGKGIGYGEGYTTVEGFWVPAYPLCGAVPFLDGRLHILDHGTLAANVGAGVRWLYTPCATLGAYCYYDFRQTRFSHYHQVGPGVELFWGRLEARANGYLPVKRHRKLIANQSTVIGPTFAGFTGNGVLVSQSSSASNRFEDALTGVDGEVGVNLIAPTYCRKLYIGGGPYYFTRHFRHHFDSPVHRRHHRRALGGKGRIFVRANRYLAFEFCDAYDQLFHNTFGGRVIIDFPIRRARVRRSSLPWQANCCGCCLPCTTLAGLAEAPNRLELVVIHRRLFTTSTSTLQTFCNNVLFVNNTAPPGGNGTIQAPFNTLAAASAASVPGSVFYVFQGDGTTTGMNQGIVLQPGQIIMGSGCPQLLPCAGVTIPAQTAGPPVITNPYGTGITLANNSCVICVEVVQNGPVAIEANNACNVCVLNSIVRQYGSGTAAMGICLPNVCGTNTISNNVVLGNGTGSYGIAVIQDGANSAVVAITNNQVSGWAGQGAIWLQNENSNTLAATVTGNLLTANSQSGIYVLGQNSSITNAMVSNNTITNSGTTGITFSANSASVINAIATGNSISSSTGNGLEIDANDSSTTNFAGFSNIISNNGGNGIAFSSPSIAAALNATLSNNTANGNAGSGIATTVPMQATATLLLTNNSTVGNASGFGVFLQYTGASACVRFNQNFSSNTQQLSNVGAGILNLETPQIGNTPALTTTGTITPVPPGTCP